MATYISILRGINESGQKKVPLEQLKRLYEKLYNFIEQFNKSKLSF
jgi:uncharacterized protein (DUF1697 family)